LALEDGRQAVAGNTQNGKLKKDDEGWRGRRRRRRRRRVLVTGDWW